MTDADAEGSEPSWEPDLVATAPEGLADTLARAEAARVEGRLDAGDDNALALYLSVLEIAPDDADAASGIDAVVDELLRQGDAALDNGKLVEAGRLAQVAQRVRPGRPDVQAFQGALRDARKIAWLLDEARRLADAGVLVAIEGDSATTVYYEILEIQPDHPAAVAGLARLEQTLVVQATRAAEQGGYVESDRLLAEAGKVRPGSATVQDAAARLVEMRQARAAALIEQADAAIAAGTLDRADALLGELESVSVQTDDVEDLRGRLDSARLYGSLRPGQTIRDPLTSGGMGPDLVVIPVGNFRMGSPESEAGRRNNEGPARRVRFERGFAIGLSEVTVAEYRVFVRASGYQPSTARRRTSTIYDEKIGSMSERNGVTWESDHAGKRAADNLPVVHVSWPDARAYADWLAAETGKRYRLPSEAEFEYVLRAGGKESYPWGDGNPVRLVGNVTGDGDRSATRRSWVNAFPGYDDGHWGPAPVRQFEPNRFGIHDMVGNVSEWVEDCWHDNYQRAPSGGGAWVNPGCNRRVIRGASWASSPDQVRSAFRLAAAAAAETTNARVGIRVARDI